MEMSQSQGNDRRYALPFLIYFAYTLTKALWLPRLDPFAFWLADLVSFVVLPAALVVMFGLPFRLKELRDPPARIIARSWLPVAVNGFLLAFAIRMIFAINGWALAKAGLDAAQILPPTMSYTGQIPRDGPWFYIGTIYLSLSAALVEEYFYRFVLRAACRRFTASALPFVLLSGTTFALIHWGNGLRDVIAAFIVGLLLATVYVKAGDLRIPIAGHALYWLRLLVR